MKTDKNILIAFVLNLLFSILEFIGGAFTNSVAIISDAIHDMGDSISIGVSYFLEKKSKQKANNKYTYGYIRYSVIGSLITTIVLIIGSVIVVYNAVKRIITPVTVKYDGILIFAIMGVIINYIAAYYTHKGHSLNQKVVNLHMLEDVLGWAIVLLGAIIMKFTHISIIDPILSLVISAIILVNALKNLNKTVDIFLEKTPNGVDIENIKGNLKQILNVEDVHHIHVWSIDGYKNYATMHIVATKDYEHVKQEAKQRLNKLNIHHATIEIETNPNCCNDETCNT